MKFLQFYRLGFKQQLLLVPAYLSVKLFHSKKIKEQEILIAYFNILVNLKLRHVAEKKNFFIVKAKGQGCFALRKIPSSDAVVFEQIFIDKEYEELCRLAKLYLPPGKVTMIDGGANIGLTSIYVQQQLKGTHTLDAVLVEPSSDNVSMIGENLLLQKLTHFKIEKAGLYNKKCFLQITNDFRNKLEWSIQVKESAIPTDVSAMEILGIIKENGWQKCDILKLDIEGAESFLFADKQYAAAFLSLTCILALEIHKEYVDEQALLSLLKSNGFNLNRFGELYIGVNNNYVTTENN